MYIQMQPNKLKLVMCTLSLCSFMYFCHIFLASILLLPCLWTPWTGVRLCIPEKL